MKRLIVFILLVSYSIATTGTGMQLHFCMGKRSDIEWNSVSQNNTCSKCGMKKMDVPNGCCKDEYKWIKIQDDQKANIFSFQLAKIQFVEFLPFINYNYTPPAFNVGNLSADSHAPPTCYETAIYKRNCVFLI